MELYSVKNFSFKYSGTEKFALKNINLQIDSGEFIVLCGASGCGKTTLLRQMKNELAPYGVYDGEISYRGKSIKSADDNAVFEVGFVMQNPDEQIVCDKVYKELAFGLESMGINNGITRRRVAEIASFLGIGEWFSRDCASLSGGQKQILNLASVMVMQPEVIILDEPTAQLDPIAAMEFIEVIKRINRELSMTIVMSEHRLEDVFGAADRVVIMEDGKIFCDESPVHINEAMHACGAEKSVMDLLPVPVRLFDILGGKGDNPTDVRSARKFVEPILPTDLPAEMCDEEQHIKKCEILRLKDVYFKYDKNQNDILKGLDMSVCEGEIVCVLGANGAGKSTAFSVMAHAVKPYRGSVKHFKNKNGIKSKAVMLPQSPQLLFLHDTLCADLLDVGDESAADKVLSQLGISDLKNKNSLDLSGGEIQKAALAKLFLTDADVFLLDEPTKGIDGAYKAELAQIMRAKADEGKTIVIASHDVEFAASYADRCVMLFDGCVMSEDTPKCFFSQNNYYTTCANRIVRHKARWAVTVEDVMKLCKERTDK